MAQKPAIPGIDPRISGQFFNPNVDHQELKGFPSVTLRSKTNDVCAVAANRLMRLYNRTYQSYLKCKQNKRASGFLKNCSEILAQLVESVGFSCMMNTEINKDTKKRIGLAVTLSLNLIVQIDKIPA